MFGWCMVIVLKERWPLVVLHGLFVASLTAVSPDDGLEVKLYV